MSRVPKVTRLVLFKHGVAYLERSGPASGPFELSFKKDDMNDVLKSLSVWVADGDAKVGAVGFEKPEDPERALEQRKLSFGHGAALAGLLWSLRGRRVAIEAAGRRAEGEVIGTEHKPGKDGDEVRSLALRTGEGAIAVVDLAGVSSVELLEEPSRADVAFVIDRSRAVGAGENRTVKVDLRGAARDLRVSYVVPAPTWRVTYRLAREGDATMLMAWGIVHNPADEALDDVDLVLTTGQPVSFVIDLYNPKNVQRAMVEEQTRAGAAPTQFERARAAPPPPAPASVMMAAPAPAARPQGAPAMAGYGGSFEQAAAGASEYADRGELFEYRVAQKVSLGRGGSAMVPLLFAKLDARKERIWRDGSAPSPDLVLSFANGSGAVLEEGAAVIYDEGVYAGEAMVPYSARGTDVKLAFAKDLGVRCRRTTTTRSVLVSIGVDERFAIRGMRGEAHHELTAESDHDEKVDVIFELPKLAGRSIAPEHTQPFEDTMGFRRFKLEVPPHGRASAKVVEAWPEQQTVRYENVSEPELLRWLDDKLIDANVAMQLREVLEAWALHKELDAERGRVEKRRQDAWGKQQKLSEQLGVLKDGGAEGQLRLRYVRELEQAQDLVNKCEADLAGLEVKMEQAKSSAEERLRTLAR